MQKKTTKEKKPTENLNESFGLIPAILVPPTTNIT